jgi:hypothetical protein
MAQTEMQSYSVIQKIADAEIRFYPPVMMAQHTSKSQGSGFGKLFGYISGNNTNNTKIAMTTPVHMKKKNRRKFYGLCTTQKIYGRQYPPTQ